MKEHEGAIQYTARGWADEHTPGEFKQFHHISIFDPVLCELVYRWFCPPAGVILDPFAGGSVRGIVAAKLGRHYVGVDLSAPQVVANRQQAQLILSTEDPSPIWLEGDSREIRSIAAGVEADLIFTCPPYADLEVYSDHPRDISRLSYQHFRAAYAAIIAASCLMLKPDRFAAIVVGEVRDKAGNYYGFVPDTIAAFRRAGLSYYNEAILATPTGSLAIRAGKQFDVSRKMGKTHQNLLVFVKGDPKVAATLIGPTEFAVPEPHDDAAPADDGHVDDEGRN
jgi:DNA modification methylase